jgi:hypothetical protein
LGADSSANGSRYNATMSQLCWSYGLSEFLRRSNEDAVCSSFIGKLVGRGIRRTFPDCKRFLRVADVGCGSASKAIAIAQYLNRYGIQSDWDLIDRDEQWRGHIESNIARCGERNDMRFKMFCPVSAEAWSAAMTVKPDVAQFIHVPYDDESEDMVYDLTGYLATNGSFIIIGAEHPESDLSLIRRKISKLGYSNLPRERTTALADRLRRRGLVVKSYVLENKYLEIGRVEELSEADWFWDLIFGRKHVAEDKAALVDTVMEIGGLRFVPSVAASVLSIPDLIITVRHRV